MATGLPVLERVRTTDTDSSLKAYGKLSGGAEPAEYTEEQKAMSFNSRIAENYQKLIDPNFKSAEDFMGGAPADVKEEAPVYESAEEYARATLYPDRPQTARAEKTVTEETPVFTHSRVTEDLFRADSPINAPRMQEYAQAEQVYAPAQSAEESYGYDAAAEEQMNADLAPTTTTIQYRNELYREEQQVAVEEKKGYAMTAKGKLLMAVYAVVVVVVLALIIINTSVLRTLDADVKAKESALNEVYAQYAQVQDKIAEATSDETVIEWGLENGFTFGE